MIRISRADYDAIRKHGEETYPQECCGVLLGRMENGERMVKAVVRCGNTRADAAANRYHIDPRELIAAQKQARAARMDIVGFYHSHPDHPPHWSETDLAEAHWFACSYVITRVDAGIASLTNSFVLAGTEEQDKRFDNEQLVVMN